PLDSPRRSHAISAALRPSAPSSWPWQKRSQAGQAGRSFVGLNAGAGASTNRQQITRTAWEGGPPILRLHMYEHAYHLDFGAKAAAFVDQVMANRNWERIGVQYRRAIGEAAGEDELFLPFGAPSQEEARISAEELKAALESEAERRPVLVDLCLPRDMPRRRDMLAGASMHAPAALPSWSEGLPRDRSITVYCICGFQVSGTAVTELRRRGYNARALVGGITAWHAIGGATVPLDTLLTRTRRSVPRLGVQESREDRYVDVASRQDDRDPFALQCFSLLEERGERCRASTLSDVMSVGVDDRHRLSDLCFADAHNLSGALPDDRERLGLRLPTGEAVRKGIGAVRGYGMPASQRERKGGSIVCNHTYDLGP